MKPIYPLFAALFLVAALPAHAQQNGGNTATTESEEESNTTETDGPRRFWQASLSNGHYMVALDRISNISMHEYLLDGSVVVTEVTIDTTGRALARFYYLEPLSDAGGRDEVSRVVDKGRELLDRAGQKAGTEAHNMAQKTYPTTTHAGTIEYRITDKRDLDALYGSLRKAWETGKGRKLTIK
ncbi:hypothetical protein ACFQY0_07605 [Haloferula chungangensis]|uniref:DUF4468 domain-containing protein n=1 Tax=Haloferula chungangensis TaxID=1048331 RepID=A0ABW2L692_9BACT